MADTAKLFMSGGSQAVRLPVEFRFDGQDVFIRKDPATGDVILSRRPHTWQNLLDVFAETAASDDFLLDRHQDAPRPDPFFNWEKDDLTTSPAS